MNTCVVLQIIVTISIKLGKNEIKMEVKLKFKVGEEVFFMHNNKVCEGTIVKTTITIESCTEIKYKIKIKGTLYDKSLLETKIFKSKEDLLKSL